MKSTEQLANDIRKWHPHEFDIFDDDKDLLKHYQAFYDPNLFQQLDSLSFKDVTNLKQEDIDALSQGEASSEIEFTPSSENPFAFKYTSKDKPKDAASSPWFFLYQSTDQFVSAFPALTNQFHTLVNPKSSLLELDKTIMQFEYMLTPEGDEAYDQYWFAMTTEPWLATGPSGDWRYTQLGVFPEKTGDGFLDNNWLGNERYKGQGDITRGDGWRLALDNPSRMLIENVWSWAADDNKGKAEQLADNLSHPMFKTPVKIMNFLHSVTGWDAFKTIDAAQLEGLNVRMQSVNEAKQTGNLGNPPDENHKGLIQHMDGTWSYYKSHENFFDNETYGVQPLMEHPPKKYLEPYQWLYGESAYIFGTPRTSDGLVHDVTSIKIVYTKEELKDTVLPALKAKRQVLRSAIHETEPPLWFSEMALSHEAGNDPSYLGIEYDDPYGWRGIQSAAKNDMILAKDLMPVTMWMKETHSNIFDSWVENDESLQIALQWRQDVPLDSFDDLYSFDMWARGVTDLSSPGKLNFKSDGWL